MIEEKSMLLVAPVPVRMTTEGGLEIEIQAANGLRQWASNFKEITLCAPEKPNALNNSSIEWCPIELLPNS